MRYRCEVEDFNIDWIGMIGEKAPDGKLLSDFSFSTHAEGFGFFYVVTLFYSDINIDSYRDVDRKLYDDMMGKLVSI